MEFIRRYCSPKSGWEVHVDIDPSEVGRTGGEKIGARARDSRIERRKDGEIVCAELAKLGVQVNGSRSAWSARLGFPCLPGDRDLIAFHRGTRCCVIAEMEGVSGGQPEQKIYKAIGEIVMALSQNTLSDWHLEFVPAVHGAEMVRHLAAATVLTKLGVSVLAVAPDRVDDRWILGACPVACC